MSTVQMQESILNTFAKKLASRLDMPIFSPFGVGYVLSLLNLGAGCQTYLELTRLFEGQLTAFQLANMHKILGPMMSNFVFVNEKYKLKNVYSQIISPLAIIENKNFNDPNMLTNVNNLIATKTNNMIQSTIPVINPDMIMIILNVIYFKMNWDKQFNKTLSYQCNFHGIAGIYPVQMMTQTNEFNYFEDNNVQVIELPYEKQEFSMIIMLPRENVKNPKFNLAYIDRMLPHCNQQEVIVHLPRFTSDAHCSLVKSLRQLDACTMFTENADFNLISSTPSFVSEIIHAAKIIVDEEGTEIGTVVYEDCWDDNTESPKLFLADHPFAYTIIHKPSQLILFMGNFCG